MNPIKNKADSLADRMNALTEKFNLSEEMVLVGEDVEDLIKDKTKDVDLYESEEIPIDTAVDLEFMIQDFKYVRETLKETTDNGRRVLNDLALDLLNEDAETRAELITSFAELNKAVSDNMKLYMQSYRDISSVLINIDKIRSKSNPKGGSSGNTTNNTLIVSEPISTADLIKQLREK